MLGEKWATVTPDAVLAFWFPDDGHPTNLEAHRAYWTWRMRGSADEPIRSRFNDLTEAAARGLLDNWVVTPRGRLALVIALDQFSRSVWRDTPTAFSQDIKAARLVLEGLKCGHYDALQTVWEKAFCLIALSHCEGPEHLERMDRVMELSAALIEDAPEHLRLSYRLVEDQARLVREVIASFGRHPHRNDVLGRPSTPEEEVYLAAGVFPHQRAVPPTREGLENLLEKRQSVVGTTRRP